MKISRLIKYLQHIQNTYSDMEIDVNIIHGERMELSSICVEDNYTTGFCEEENSNDRYTLLLEGEICDSKWKPVFSTYEYPSMEEINLPSPLPCEK